MGPASWAERIAYNRSGKTQKIEAGDERLMVSTAIVDLVDTETSTALPSDPFDTPRRCHMEERGM